VGENARTRHERAVAASVSAPEKLVTATDGEQRRAAGDRVCDPLALRRQIGRDERLLAILSAADVEEIVRAGRDVVPETDRDDLELMSTEGSAAAEHRDVPAVGVDVQVLGIEMSDADPQRCSFQ
jgi:hypothetical protein